MPETAPTTEDVTIADLISLLHNFNPETKVLVPGYENGWDYLGDLELISVKQNTYTEWWNGDVIRDNNEVGEIHLALHRRPKER